MLRPSAALVAIALAASTVMAQRGGGGGGGTGRERPRQTQPDYGAVHAAGLRLSNGDVEDMDPVRRLLDKRKDLKLTDEQQKQLRGIDDKLKESNQPAFKVLDSLRQAMRPRAGMDADAERARITLTRENVISVLTTIRRNYSDGLTGALGLLDALQKPKADELLGKQSAETEEALRDKLGTGLDGMAGGRRGERPPPA